MKRACRILTCVLLMSMPILSKAENSFNEAVRNSVSNQMTTYPRSTLRDLYKNFFQDKFGPGHIITDTVSAGNYLKSELENSKTFSGDDFESLGWQGNFIRVNLRLIKDSVVSYNQFFKSFIESLKDFKPISQKDWIKEWTAIDSVIFSMNLNLPNYRDDRSYIFDLLDKGNFVMHHSEAFEKTYEPHYRIMDKKHAELLRQKCIHNK